MTQIFSKSLLSRWFGRRPATVSRRNNRVRLGVEILEERDCPATISINSLLDTTVAGDGNLTLREAIVAINNATTGGNTDFTGHISGPAFGTNDTINFAPGLIGSVKLTQGQLVVSKSVTINGLGASQDTIDAQLNSRVIDVTAVAVNLNLSGLTITGGKVVGTGGAIYANSVGDNVTLTNSTVSGNTTTGGSGGGVDAYGNVTLTNSTVSKNTATGGNGGAVAAVGNVTLTNSTVSGNTAGIKGGGVFSNSAVTLTNSTVSGNSASYGAGGVYAGNGALTLTNSTVSGNSAGTIGGGVYAENGAVTLTNSTVSGNIAGTIGGGIYAEVSTVTLTNSTVSGNTAGTNGGGVYAYSVTLTNSTIANNKAQAGAGLYTAGGTISDSTIAGNQASGGKGGGGILVRSSEVSTVNLNNTIVANNTDTSGNGPDIDNLGRLNAKHSLVRSTVGNGVTATVANGNIINADPKLGPLRNNGGPTQTMGLKAGSPAINTGDNTLIPAGTTTDQRGAARIFGGTVDIGAFEVQPVPTTTTVVSSLNPAKTNQSVTFTATVNSALFGLVKAGTITFYDNGTAIATVVLNASGQAAFTTATLRAGNHTITAVFQPDAADDTGFTTSQGSLIQVVKAALIGRRRGHP